MINLFSFTITSILLIYASYIDLRKRLIPDQLWLIGFVAAGALQVHWYSTASLTTPDYAGTLILLACAPLLNIVKGLGGADKLAVALVAALNPGLLFSVIYLLALTASSIAYALKIKRGSFPYLPAITAAYLIAAIIT